MEEFDDLLQKPDDSGVLDMSHRAWVTLDDVIWSWGTTLLVLDISFNEITVVPEGLGELTLLREFNCASNRLRSLPAAIGRCTRLKVLKCNGNRLDTLPSDVSKCKALHTIIASENVMQLLPSSLGELPVLRMLDVQNNRLEGLPYELGDCASLETLDCTGNPDLAMVPSSLRDNTKLILWICREKQRHLAEVEELKSANIELEELAKTYDDQKISMKEQIVELKKKNKKLVSEQPRVYMKVKRGVKGCASSVCTVM